MGAAAATRLYEELVAHTLQTALEARQANVIGDVIVHGTPDIGADAFQRWQRDFGVALAAQSAGDLGTRMQKALEAALARGTPALLIGTDAPALDVTNLAEAARALDTHDAVFGPAEDGGYVLVGLRRALDVFDGIAWSGPEVMAQTRERLRALGATWFELPTSWDVDRPEDVQRWHTLRARRGYLSTPSVQDQL
jgi:rSAM/selenodomain-associated transferase 1